MKQPIIKPAHLRKGDTVGIISPSSPAFEASDIEFTFEWLGKLGLKYKLGKHFNRSYSDMAGSDRERADDFHAMVADPGVQAILPIRGGNGGARLLPLLDFDLIRAHPKILIGYSDLTALLNAVASRTGIVTFHGPMGGSFFRSSYSHHYFVKALMSNRPIGLIVDPLPGELWSPKYPPPRIVIAEGKARAPLVGGCMTLVRQLMGTPWELDTKDKILFLEDVHEEPHSIDRYLTQLLLAGKLQETRGIIVGECVSCRPGQSHRKVMNVNSSVEDILRDRLGNLGVPVVYGMRFGHGNEQFTLPIGVNAVLDVRPGKVKFKIDEAATN